MVMSWRRKLIIGIVVAGGSNFVLAAVSADEAKVLGTTLTSWGAEVAGNKDGTIPAYTGEALAPPADYNPAEPMRWPSPFSKEKPLFSITAQNMSQYAAKLTEGQKTLFKKYPNYRMDVFPTHRTATFPKWYEENSIKNATSCKTDKGGVVVLGCYGGQPFPIPKTGNEVMWNHQLYYSGYTTENTVFLKGPSWLVPASGTPVLQADSDFTQNSDYFNPSATTPADPKALYWKIRVDINGPARRVGEKILVHSSLDAFNPGIRIYQYIPGQRRVKLAPDLAYDTPNPVEGGNSTMDQNRVFQGAQDRYEFKLLGKQEKFIMYNNYEVTDYKACPDEKLLTKNFPNPDCVRWELHRVFVVDAKIKAGFRHIMPHRVFYFDEDFPGVGISDDYDAAGVMYRVTTIPFQAPYMVKESGGLSGPTYTHDVQTGNWSATVAFGKKGNGVVMKVPLKPAVFYSPEALAGEGIR